MHVFRLQVGCAHGPGGKNDPGLTLAESRTHFGSWAIVSSPLTLSHDVNNDTITDAIWPIITNTEALEVSQAYAGHSGTQVCTTRWMSIPLPPPVGCHIPPSWGSYIV